MQELHRTLNMPQYDYILIGREYACTIIDRVLNMSNTIHSSRSLLMNEVKLMNTY